MTTTTQGMCRLMLGILCITSAALPCMMPCFAGREEEEDGLHALERDLLQEIGDRAWKHILAWLLLYSTMAKSSVATYSSFLRSMPSVLRRHLLPAHVAAFVRECSGIGGADALLVLVIDEAHRMLQLPKLLSAFVEFRIKQASSGYQHSAGQTVPVCVVTSTVWTHTKLQHTNTRRARIKDLVAQPLGVQQAAALFVQMCKRIQQPNQQQQQQQQGWPTFSLHPDDSSLQLPRDTMSLLELTGGHGRLLSYLLGAMIPGGQISK